MRITELISKLEEIHREYGDIPVSVRVDGFGGHGLYSTENRNLSISGIYPSELKEDFDSNVAKEYFPESEGDLEGLENLPDEEVETVVISTGPLIYRT
jgi:hypothetical protein